MVVGDGGGGGGTRIADNAKRPMRLEKGGQV